MKMFFLRDNTWVELVQIELTAQEQSALANVSAENETARKQLLAELQDRAERPAIATDAQTLNDIYSQHKPANATLISATVILPQRSGVFNWRVNGEHVQVRL